MGKINVGDRVRISVLSSKFYGQEGVVRAVMSRDNTFNTYTISFEDNNLSLSFYGSELEVIDESEDAVTDQLDLVKEDFRWRVSGLHGRGFPAEVMEDFLAVAKKHNVELVTVTSGANVSRVLRTKVRKFKKGDKVFITGTIFQGTRAVVGEYDSFLDEFGEVELTLTEPILYDDGTEHMEVGSTLIYKEKYLVKDD